MWDKIGKLALEAGKLYVEKRGVEGVLEDAGKLKNGISNLFSSDSNGDGEIDSSEIQNWMDSFVPEMQACLKEAKRHDVLSKEFEQNIRYVLTTGYDAINQIIDIDEDLHLFGDYANEIDALCDEALELIYKKCQGTTNTTISTSNRDKAFAMEVKGSYPVNFCHNMTIITGCILSGKAKRDQIIPLPTGEFASIKFICMFGKKLEEAECADVCALILDGDFYSDLEDLTPFTIGKVLDSEPKEIEIPISNEQEYLAEVKTCLDESGSISERERRLLNRLRQSLGISEQRGAELEATLQTSALTSEEQEYADEVKACLEEGGSISSRERRLLDKLRTSLGISMQRAEYIEKAINR